MNCTGIHHAAWTLGTLLVAMIGQSESAEVFDSAAYKRFIDHELSRVRPSCGMAEMGVSGRTVKGSLANHQGVPIPNVIVALVEPIGHSLDCYYENFDTTDDQGRFEVAGSVSKNRLIFRHANGRIWREKVADGESPKRIEWPEPATVRVNLGEALQQEFEIAANKGDDRPKLSLQTQKYWSGMSVMVISEEIAADGTAVFHDVVPGEYFLTLPKVIQVSGQPMQRNVELAQLHVNAGAQESLSLSPSRGTRLTGSCPIGSSAEVGQASIYLIAKRIQQTYEDQPPAIEMLPITGGRFETRPLPKGDYRVEAWVRGVPQPQNRFAMGDRPVGTWIVSVDGTAPRVNLDESPPTELESAVSHALDSATQPNGSLAAKQLATHWPENEIVAELIKRLKRDAIPYAWRRTLPEIIRSISESDEVTDELIAVFKTTVRWRQRNDLMKVLQTSTYQVAPIVDLISPHLVSDNHLTRSTAVRALGELAVRNPQHSTAIAKQLESALRDPWEFIRLSSAVYLGRIGSTNSVPVLLEAREDQHPPVAMYAASSVWQIVGDPDDAIPVMTETLGRNGISGLWEAAYLMQPIAKVHPIPKLTQTKLRQVATMSGKPPFRNKFQYEQSRAAGAAQRVLDIIEERPRRLEKAE